jgi:exopolyphosphatase/guanosine-5'-triphosphate,3'-diphosphate pyrophosphatase
MAESLDRSHAGIVRHARLEDEGRKNACLVITAVQDCTLEVWGLNTHLDSFRKTFGKRLEVKLSTKRRQDTP